MKSKKKTEVESEGRAAEYLPHGFSKTYEQIKAAGGLTVSKPNINNETVLWSDTSRISAVVE